MLHLFDFTRVAQFFDASPHDAVSDDEMIIADIVDREKFCFTVVDQVMPDIVRRECHVMAHPFSSHIKQCMWHFDVAKFHAIPSESEKISFKR